MLKASIPATESMNKIDIQTNGEKLEIWIPREYAILDLGGAVWLYGALTNMIKEFDK